MFATREQLAALRVAAETILGVPVQVAQPIMRLYGSLPNLIEIRLPEEQPHESAA